MSTLISLNGIVDDSIFSFLRENFSFSQVLGVDGGTQHLLKAAIKPTMVIGDLDSIGSFLKDVLDARVPMLISYWDKDFTDGERAIKVARSTPFVFLGLVGEEVDHLLGNFSLLRQAFSMKKPAVAYGINETILYGRDFSLNLPQGTTFSIVPCSRILLSEKGSKWELQDALWSGYATPPISNIATGTVQHIHGSNEFFLIVKGYWNPFSELTA